MSTNSIEQQGFVLPMALIVLALLTTLSMGLSQMARNSLADVQQRKEMFEQQLALQNSMQWSLYGLLTGAPDKQIMQVGKVLLPINNKTVEHGGVSIRIQDVAGLLGLAFYNPKYFRNLLQNLTTKQNAAAISSRLNDWIDSDSRAGHLGMEVADYLKAGKPMLPRNAAIRSLDELLEIPGITPELYNGSAEKPGLRDLLMAGGTDAINLATAPNAVLGAVLGISAERLQEVLALREKGNWQKLRLVINAFPELADTVSFSPDYQYRILLSGMYGYTARAVVRLTPFNILPYEIILWQYPDHARG